jgi:superfamily II DNA or RNA helicase
LIVNDVKKVIEEGRTPIVLTSLTSHVRELAEMLSPLANHVITLVGADSAKEKKVAMERLRNIPSTESLVIVATGKYIGEGFDYPRLDTLFLVLPISWKGNIAQYAGRLHRDCNGKSEARIYDYVDIRVPLCDSMYRKRLKGYASVGYGTTFTSDKAEISKHELIFDGNTYKVAFHQDLIGIRQSLVISCQRIKYKYPPRFISQLRDLLHNGIEIAIHIKERGYNEEDLSSSGLDIIYRECLSIQCVVIDKSIVWYGNVNFFGYNNEDNNVMRICDASIASELLNVIYEENL